MLRFRSACCTHQPTSVVSASSALFCSIRCRPTRIGGGIVARTAPKRLTSTPAARPRPANSPTAPTSKAAAKANTGEDAWSSMLSMQSAGSSTTLTPASSSAPLPRAQKENTEVPPTPAEPNLAAINKPAETDKKEPPPAVYSSSSQSWNPLKNSPEFVALLKDIRVSAGPNVSRPEHLLRVSQYDNSVQSLFEAPKDIVLLFHELANTTLREQQMLAITGQTGVGKSSIVPILLSALLEEKIPTQQQQQQHHQHHRSCLWMTQPTRAACIGLVHYMCRITNTQIGEEIGYGTGAGDGAKWSHNRTKIIVCTPGYAAKYLSHNHHHHHQVSSNSSSSSSNNANSSKRHHKKSMGCHTMIVDEAHSVDEHLETLLTVCGLQLRDTTALVFMSATMDFPVLQRMFSVAHRSTARSLHLFQTETFMRFVFQPNHIFHVLCHANKILPKRFVSDRLSSSLATVQEISAHRVASNADRMLLLSNAAYKDLAELLMRLACSSEPRSGTKKRSKKDMRLRAHPNSSSNKSEGKSGKQQTTTTTPADAQDDDAASDVSSVLVFLPGFQEMQHLTGHLFRAFRAYTSVDSEGRGDVLYMSRFHIEAPRRFFSAADADYEQHDAAWTNKTGKLQKEHEEGEEVVEVMMAHSSVLGHSLGSSGSTSFGFDMANEYGDTPWYLKGRRPSEVHISQSSSPSSSDSSSSSLPSSPLSSYGVTDENVIPGRKFRGRTIVLATNVAESSVTIPNLKFVVDLGLERFEQRSRSMANWSFLATRWISETSARQRAGRVGRTCDGYVLRCYPKEVLRKEHVGIDTARPADEGEAESAGGNNSSKINVVMEDDEDARTTVLFNNKNIVPTPPPTPSADPATAVEDAAKQELLKLQQEERAIAVKNSAALLLTSSSSTELNQAYMIERLLLTAFSLPSVAKNYSLSELRSCWIHRVSAVAVEAAVARLQHDGFLVADSRFKAGYRLTRGGLVVSHLPLPLSNARFLWYGLVFGCAIDALVVAAVTPTPNDLFVVNSVRRVPTDDARGEQFARPPQWHKEGRQQVREATATETQSGADIWTALATATKPAADDIPAAVDINSNLMDVQGVSQQPQQQPQQLQQPVDKSAATSPAPGTYSLRLHAARGTMDAFKNAHLTRQELGIEEHLSDPWMLRQLVVDWLSLPRRSMRRRQTGPLNKIAFETRYLKPQTAFVDRVGVRGRRLDEIDATIIRCAKALDEALSSPVAAELAQYEEETEEDAGQRRGGNNIGAVARGTAAGGAAAGDEWSDELSQLRALQVLVRTGCAIGDKQLEACEALFGPLPERVNRGKDEVYYGDDDLQRSLLRSHYSGRNYSAETVKLNEQMRRSRLLMAYAAAYGDKLVVGAPSESQYQGLFSRSTALASSIVQQQLKQDSQQQQQHRQYVLSLAAAPLPALVSSKTDQSLIVLKTPNAVIVDDHQYHATTGESAPATATSQSNSNARQRRFMQLPPDFFAECFVRRFVRGSLHDKMRVDVRGTVSFVSLPDEDSSPAASPDTAAAAAAANTTTNVRYDLAAPAPAVSFATLEASRTLSMLVADIHGVVVQVPRSKYIEIPSASVLVTNSFQPSSSAQPPAAVDPERKSVTTDEQQQKQQREKYEPLPADTDPDWIVIRLTPPRARVQSFPRCSDDSFRCDRVDGGKWIAFRRSAVSRLGMASEVEDIEKIATVLSPTLAISDRSVSSNSNIAAPKPAVEEDVEDDPSDIIADDDCDDDRTETAHTKQQTAEVVKPQEQQKQQQVEPQQQPPSPFVQLYAHSTQTHVLHHPQFYLVGRYTGDESARRLASSHRFRMGDAMAILGALANSNNNSNNSNNNMNGGGTPASSGPASAAPAADEFAADSARRNLTKRDHLKMLLKLVEEDPSFEMASSSADADGNSLLDSSEGATAAPSLVASVIGHRSTEEEQREVGDDTQMAIEGASRRSRTTTSSSSSSSFDVSADADHQERANYRSQQALSGDSVAPTRSGNNNNNNTGAGNPMASTVAASGLHISRIKRQHCALCGKVVPRLASVPGHRYSTRHLARLCGLLLTKIPLAEVCRVFSSEASTNIVSVSSADSQSDTSSADKKDESTAVIHPVPSSSFSATVFITGVSHLRALRFQPTFSGGGVNTRAGWNDGVLFGFIAVVALPSANASLAKSGYVKGVWLLPPPAPSQTQRPRQLNSSSSASLSPRPPQFEAPLIDELLAATCIAGASSGNTVRLLVEATASGHISGLVAVQAFPFPPMALRQIATLHDPAVASFLEALALCKDSLRAVSGAAASRRLRRLMFGFLGKKVAVSSSSDAKQQQQTKQNEEGDGPASSERVWIRFDPRFVRNESLPAGAPREFKLSVTVPASIFQAGGSELLTIEARLLNAVLMALTADAIDGRVTVDRIVHRFVLQSGVSPSSSSSTAISADQKLPASFQVPSSLSNSAALHELDMLCRDKGYASLHEMLVLACGAVPLEAQLGAMTAPIGVDERNVACGSLLMSRLMLPSRIVKREEALQTTASEL